MKIGEAKDRKFVERIRLLLKRKKNDRTRRERERESERSRVCIPFLCLPNRNKEAE